MVFENLSITYGSKFGTVQPEISLMDMKGNGIDFGDSLNIYFDNGCRLIDVPYYNGFYVKTGMPLVCGYPGYKHPAICRNNGGDLWIVFGLSEANKVSIEINEKGKYLTIQNIMDTVYTNNRDDYASDEIFANYRAMKGGNLKDNFFYRSASPCDNQYSRAKYSSLLMEKDKVNFILNIADKEEEITAYRKLEDYDYPYFDSLYDNGHVSLLDLSADYCSEIFKETLIEGIKKMMNYDGPYLTHCTEGKDRTGFVCMLIEALMGASYKEMKEDYMTTYFNYYGITEENNPEKYNAICDLKFDDMVMYLGGTNNKEELTHIDYTEGAVKYLKDGGMSEEEVQKLIKILSK